MLFRTLSEYSILLPILAGIIIFKKANTLYRLLLFFLIYGFITDLIVGNERISYQTRFMIFQFYPLIETIVLLWFMLKINLDSKLEKACKLMIIVLPLFWIYCHAVSYDNTEGFKRMHSVYNSTYTLTISIFAGFALLKLSEKNSNLGSLPLFWFLLTIFINCFCNFFIKNLMDASFLKKVWYLTNIINILCYITLAIGYFLIRRYEEKPLILKNSSDFS